MTLILPNFANRRCLRIDLCGHISQEDSQGVNPPPELANGLIAEYGDPGQKLTIGVVLPYPLHGERPHIHFRLRAERQNKKPTIKNAQTEDILKLVEPYLGKKIATEVEGVYRVALTELSPLVRSTFVESIADKVQVRMTGGTLTIRGSPIYNVTWKLLDRTSAAEVTLKARTEAILDGSYVVDAIELMESAFAAFVLEENRDS